MKAQLKSKIISLIPLIFTALGILLVFLMVNHNNHTTEDIEGLTKQNNAYHRTVTCILSVPLADRTNAYIKECYDKAEEAAGTKVDRFGQFDNQ